MKQTIITSLSFTAFVLSLGMLGMYCLDTGLARMDAYPEKVALKEVAFSMCVDDHRGLNRTKGYDSTAYDDCQIIMSGGASL